jgi:hypothetical protein
MESLSSADFWCCIPYPKLPSGSGMRVAERFFLTFGVAKRSCSVGGGGGGGVVKPQQNNSLRVLTVVCLFEEFVKYSWWSWILEATNRSTIHLVLSSFKVKQNPLSPTKQTTKKAN